MIESCRSARFAGRTRAAVGSLDPESGRGHRLWAEHFFNPREMMAVTSVMCVQQLHISTLDFALKPCGATCAQYEVLVPSMFSSNRKLPQSKSNERLMVYPTSVTNAIDRWTAQGRLNARDFPALNALYEVN